MRALSHLLELLGLAFLVASAAEVSTALAMLVAGVALIALGFATDR